MSHTLVISEDLYQQLASTAERLGLSRVEQLLEKWQADQQENRRRAEVVQHIDEIRNRLYGRLGEMPDSANLIREDRER
jgi:hypothetical protein